MRAALLLALVLLASCDEYTIYTGRSRYEDRDAGLSRREQAGCQEWADAEYRDCLGTLDLLDEKHQSHRKGWCEDKYQERMKIECAR